MFLHRPIYSMSPLLHTRNWGINYLLHSSSFVIWLIDWFFYFLFFILKQQSSRVQGLGPPLGRRAVKVWCPLVLANFFSFLPWASNSPFILKVSPARVPLGLKHRATGLSTLFEDPAQAARVLLPLVQSAKPPDLRFAGLKILLCNDLIPFTC